MTRLFGAVTGAFDVERRRGKPFANSSRRTLSSSARMRANSARSAAGVYQSSPWCGLLLIAAGDSRRP
jgi:hypothetical protein